MSELRTLCNEIGFERVQTYIASGNVVFRSEKSAKAVKAALEASLREYFSNEVGVVIRTASEIRRVLTKNPFADKAPNYTMAILLDDKPGKDALAGVSGQKDEVMRLGDREIYVHYPAGAGQSKLKIPAAKVGTARNMNTISKMVELSGARNGA
jgi:uncharacterized protein (DUF1697 family)